MRRAALILLGLLVCSSFCIGRSKAPKEGVQEVNPLANVSPVPGYCSIFHNWGFIGDSLSSGEVEYITQDGRHAYRDIYEYSWGQRMCALMGVRGTNYSKGGETTKGWIDNFWDHSYSKFDGMCARDQRHQAYIIALGLNDNGCFGKEGWEDWTVGSVSSDVTFDDYTKNAISFAGCYAGIIQRIRSIQPDAVVFVVTMPEEKGHIPEMNEVIRSMAATFENVYVIDLARYAMDQYRPESQWHKNHFALGHLSPAGYEYTAWMFMTYIDWIVRNNMEKFRYASLIGTGLL